MDIDKLFDKMREAPMFGRGNYMSEGTYEVAIRKAFVKESFKGPVLFICEFEIVTSSNPKHVSGSSGSWAPKISLPNTFGDIKSLMFSILGRDPKEVTSEDADAHALVTLLAKATCDSDSAKAELAGMGIPDVGALIVGVRVGLECEQTKTKAGGDFTRYTWSPAKAA